MNIVNALTLRHLKLNKRRTIVTIIGVILSVSMITAVSTIVVSFLSMMQRSVMADSGNWHVLYRDIPSQNVDIVMNDENTDTILLSKDIGYAVLEGSKNKNKPYLFIKSYDGQAFINYNVNLIDGRLPENPNEVVISSHIAENGGVKYEIGDVLKLDIGERYSYIAEGEAKVSLGQSSGFRKATDDNEGEKFVAKFTKEYTITGIITRPGFEPYWSPGYTVISYLDKNEFTSTDTVNVSVVWKKINKKANEHANKLFESVRVLSNTGSNGSNIGDASITYNRELLRYYGIIGDGLLTTLYTLAAIVIVLIIIGSVALIYNSFAISIAERSRHLGMLASVGATKKQKSNSVFFESFIIGLIGIPLGVFFGTLGIGITFILVQPLMEGIIDTGVKLTLVTSPGAILAAVLLSVFTIFISAYVPARRASKISPINAIRQSQDIKLTGKAVKTSKLTRKIFGFEAELGLKNLKRNSRRYKATVFSLIISIVLFLSVSSLSLLSRNAVDVAAGSLPYDVSVFVTSSATLQEKKDFYAEIAKMDYADQSVIEQTMYTTTAVESKLIPDKIKEIIEPDYKEKNIETYEIDFQIRSIDETALEKYAKEVGIDVVRLKDRSNPCGILVNTITVNVDNKYSQMKHFNIEPGERLKLTHLIFGNKTYKESEESEPKEYSSILEIAAVTDHTSIGDTTYSPLRAILIVSEEVYSDMQSKLPKGSDDTNVHMFIKSSNPEKLIESINEYQKRTSIADTRIYDVAAADKANRQFETFVFVFFYGFVALITAICATNIFNTISTGILLRKREFAMLKSVGITPEGFNKMINYESLFYAIKALFYGLPISFGVMYLIYRTLSNSFGFAFAIPWCSVLAAVIVVFALVGSTMIYSSSKIKKENIIDVLKKENI
jgi:putative ABC transport system permease protein